MRQNRKMKLVTVAVMIALLITLFPTAAVAYTPVPINGVNKLAEETLSVPAFPHVKRVSDTSLEVSWNKVNRASGYEVYRYNKVMKKYVLAKSIQGSSSVKWLNKRLEKNTKYRYKVRAWRTDSGNKEYSGFSYAVSALTYKKDATTVNAGTKFKGGRSMTIGLGQKLQLNASVTPSLLSKAKKKKVVDQSVRVLLLDQPCIQKAGSTKIVGKQVGATNVYALAHNGNIKKIPVTVVDYAKAKAWQNLDKMNSEVVILFTEQYDDFTDMVSWLSQHNEIEGELKLDKDGNLINSSGIELDHMENMISAFLKQYKPESMIIGLYKQGIQIDIWCGAQYTIVFNIQDAYDDEQLNDIYAPGLKLADHWAFRRFVGI